MEVKRTIQKNPNISNLGRDFLNRSAQNYKGQVAIRPKSLSDWYKKNQQSGLSKSLLALQGAKIYLVFQHLDNKPITKSGRLFLENYEDEIAEGEWTLYGKRDMGFLPFLNIRTLFVYFGNEWDPKTVKYALRNARGIRRFVFQYNTPGSTLFQGIKSEEIEPGTRIVLQPFRQRKSQELILSLSKCHTCFYSHIQSINAAGSSNFNDVDIVLFKRFISTFLRYSKIADLNTPTSLTGALREIVNVVREAETE